MGPQGQQFADRFRAGVVGTVRKGRVSRSRPVRSRQPRGRGEHADHLRIATATGKEQRFRSRSKGHASVNNRWLCSESFKLADRVQFPSGSLHIAKWWNLVDTRRSEGRARKSVRVQLSSWLLVENSMQVGRCPTSSHDAGVPGSLPGPAT